MKYTIFTQFENCFLYSGNLANVLDHAKDLAIQGNEVYVVYCDAKLHHQCWLNMTSDKSICRICMKYRMLLLKQLPKTIKLIPISSYKYAILPHTRPDISNMEELKKTEYRGVKIGYAALSSYLTLSRNLNPLFDQQFKDYIGTWISLGQDYTDITNAIINDTQPDVVACFNSRIIHSRPIIDTAEKRGLKHLCYETAYNIKNQQVKITYDITPHSVEGNTKITNNLWESDKFPKEEKIKIAERFFYNRRHSIKAGDKLYVKDQILGKIPEGWDKQKYNILILNSSEDEYASIGDEFIDKSIFPNQISALKYIAEHYKDRKDIHFYLRIHPNLKDIPYSYHTSLHTLFNKYDNFTVIPGDSPISTYSLIDHCNKVIVFGSTTGPEAAYWGKPVILLTYCYYSLMDICYIPENLEQLDELVFNMELAPKDKLGTLKFAYSRLNNEFEDFIYYKYHKTNVDCLGKHFELCVYETNFLRKMYAIILQMMGKRLYYKKLWFPTKENIE